MTTCVRARARVSEGASAPASVCANGMLDSYEYVCVRVRACVRVCEGISERVRK